MNSRTNPKNYTSRFAFPGAALGFSRFLGVAVGFLCDGFCPFALSCVSHWVPGRALFAPFAKGAPLADKDNRAIRFTFSSIQAHAASSRLTVLVPTAL
jgi:hypothetical protein